jgi:hypothetical protein
MVAIELQKQGGDDVDLELAQVVEGLLERGIRFFAECNTAVADGCGMEICQQCLDAVSGDRRLAFVLLEHLIDQIEARYLSSLEGEEIPHEGAELAAAVGLLAKRQLHRPPVQGVEPLLKVGRLSHQHIVADQVGLGELPAGGVHALEDQLGIVLIAGEGHIHHQQLADATADHRQISRGIAQLLKKKVVVLLDPNRWLWWNNGDAGIHHGHEGGSVGVGEQQLEALLFFLKRIGEVVLPDLGR